MYEKEKKAFSDELKRFADGLGRYITKEGDWTIRGFIDIFENVYTISNDTKVISKILELHIFPYFLAFAEEIGYKIELASCQNWYPDLTFINLSDEKIKFAVDLKTTYFDEEYPGFCNGFTLGSHGEYFVDRTSTKNIQYPYGEYAGHFCLGIMYARAGKAEIDETKTYCVGDLEKIPAVISDFIFFAEEKWKIASDKGGSGNTANIGSVQKISDILTGNGVFAKAGEEVFDDYWANFGKIRVRSKDGEFKKLSSLSEYLEYRGLSQQLNNPKAPKRRRKHE